MLAKALVTSAAELALVDVRVVSRLTPDDPFASDDDVIESLQCAQPKSQWGEAVGAML